ncbi:MAG: SDR family NAD(P)-dependent oxidoreductase, partial [Gammaproteobacteria bacterium]|nr:SDR family NAD(P)-dependent oxidoreductase [Gammaproteobacteria bacterium]
SVSAVGYFFRAMFCRRLDADFSGQIWLVTGASGGIGQAIVMDAARRGATVLAVARDEAKLEALVERSNHSERVIPMVADLALMADTESLVERLNAEGRRIDVLVNNVGVLLHEHSLTPEGNETSFATNILNHFLLTEGLIRHDLINRGGSVINISSGGMYNAPLLVSRMNVTAPQHYHGVFAYAVHKRGQAELTCYWQGKYGRSHELRFYVMHPGWVDTEGVKTSLPRFRKILRLVLRSHAQGADTAIWLAAVRPDSDPAGFWLDRKPRAAHAYASTRHSKFSADDLAGFLQQVIDRGLKVDTEAGR